MDHFGLWRLYNVDCELGLYLLLIQWLSTNVYRCTPARPPSSLTHISSSPRDQRKPMKPTYSLIINLPYVREEHMLLVRPRCTALEMPISCTFLSDCFTICLDTGMGVGRYVGFTPMWERTICGFRAGRRGYAASLLCRHINVIKNSDFSRL